MYREAVGPKSNKEKIEAAEKYFTQHSTIGNDSFRYKLRLASIISIKARNAFWPNEKLDFVNKSINLFSETKRDVESANNKFYQYEFYYFRGHTMINFPDFLKKENIALEDLDNAYELAVALKRPQKEILGTSVTLALKYFDNKEYTKARKFAEIIVNMAEDETQAKEYRKVLKKIIEYKETQ